jgi:hypothetical protein
VKALLIATMQMDCRRSTPRASDPLKPQHPR